MANEKNEGIISAVGYFDGQSSRGNFDVQLKAKFSNEQLPSALQFVAGIGKRLNLIAFVAEEKVKLGQFNVYSIRIDRDANCYITFKSNIDSVYPDNFSKLMVDEAVITFKAKVIEE